MQFHIPYENNRKIDLEMYLYNTLSFHNQNTPYWQKNLAPRQIDDLISNDFEETLSNLSKLEVDQALLRNNWLEFKPKILKNVKYSFSSGTTGPQKYCLWSPAYIEKQADYLSYYLKKRARIKNAILQGPASVYKDVNELAINKLGGVPYFIALRVEGLKPVIEKAASKGPRELIRVVKEWFGPEIEKTRRILEHDENVNFMRTAWMMAGFFEEFFGDRRNIDTVMVSGLGYSPQNHEMLKSKFSKVIPSYGYFAFGDALGKYSNGNLDYHPPFPYAIFSVVKANGEIAKYGEEGHPLFIVARPDLFLVLKEANEYARRIQPKEEFPWDGIRNPHRKIA